MRVPKKTGPCGDLAAAKGDSLINRRSFLLASTTLGTGLLASSSCVHTSKHWLVLQGKRFTVGVDQDFTLKIYRHDGQMIWQTSTTRRPTTLLFSTGSTKESRTIEFQQAASRRVEPYHEGRHEGYRTTLSSFPATDIELEVVLALDAESDELLVQLDSSSGKDRVRQIDHFYCIEKPTSQGGYMIIPHGSGYLIHADAPRTLTGEAPRGNLIGGRYTLPVFGVVKGPDTLYQIVET